MSVAEKKTLISLEASCEHFLNKFDKIYANQEINFDLTKCSSEKAISETKKKYGSHFFTHNLIYQTHNVFFATHSTI